MTKKKTARKKTPKKATKKVVKKTAKRKAPARKKRTTRREIPADQGRRPKRSDVGYKRPPAEHQFVPGESGNPAGTPPGRSNLWRYFCSYLSMTAKEIRREKRRTDLSLSEKTAMKQAEQLARKGLTGAAWPATREAWNRDEGKPVERLQIDRTETLSPEECDEIRAVMRGGKD